MRYARDRETGRVGETYHHINCQFKFDFDDLNQYFLRDGTLLVRLTTQGHEGIQVLVNVTLSIVGHLLVFEPLDCGQQAIQV